MPGEDPVKKGIRLAKIKRYGKCNKHQGHWDWDTVAACVALGVLIFLGGIGVTISVKNNQKDEAVYQAIQPWRGSLDELKVEYENLQDKSQTLESILKELKTHPKNSWTSYVYLCHDQAGKEVRGEVPIKNGLNIQDMKDCSVAVR
jgi:hypothetical protein